jgi:beta-phosphoglucomutase-like phosphatase (HAD superfamily)
VEDADAGIEAGNRAGMMTLGVGSARNNPDATLKADDLTAIDLAGLIQDGVI